MVDKLLLKYLIKQYEVITHTFLNKETKILPSY